MYFNHLGDYSGMLLNPQKFHSLIPSTFGPDECHIVLSSIFNSCIKCAFRQTSFIQEILEAFSIPKDDKKDSYTQIKCMYQKSFFSSNKFN